MHFLTGDHHSKRASHYPHRLRKVWRDWKPEPEPRHPSNTAIVGIAALAVLVAAGIYYGPDFVRYLKIRRM